MSPRNRSRVAWPYPIYTPDEFDQSCTRQFARARGRGARRARIFRTHARLSVPARAGLIAWRTRSVPDLFLFRRLRLWWLGRLRCGPCIPSYWPQRSLACANKFWQKITRRSQKYRISQARGPLLTGWRPGRPPSPGGSVQTAFRLVLLEVGTQKRTNGGRRRQV